MANTLGNVCMQWTAIALKPPNPTPPNPPTMAAREMAHMADIKRKLMKFSWRWRKGGLAQLGAALSIYMAGYRSVAMATAVILPSGTKPDWVWWRLCAALALPLTWLQFVQSRQPTGTAGGQAAAAAAYQSDRWQVSHSGLRQSLRPRAWHIAMPH